MSLLPVTLCKVFFKTYRDFLAIAQTINGLMVEASDTSVTMSARTGYPKDVGKTCLDADSSEFKGCRSSKAWCNKYGNTPSYKGAARSNRAA